MAENSKIEWTDHTHNPWVGCSKISPACKNCYAEGWAKRTGQANLWQGERRRTSEANWRQPLKWNREAAQAGVRRRVFCASLADVFEDHPAIMPGWRADLGNLILQTPHLDWLLLTKRPENINRLLPDFWINFTEPYGMPPNVWIGTTVENQEQADKRIPELLKIPAAVRFLSCEPLLGPVDLTGIGSSNPAQYPLFDCLRGKESPGAFFRDAKIHWVIAGGESGPNARPMHPDWARSLRDQCQAAGVPFHFKQHGEYVEWTGDQSPSPSWRFPHPDNTPMVRAGKKAAGRLLDGVEWNQFPAVTR